MLDMGFLPDIRKIIDLVPKKRQTLLFSATFSDDIRRRLSLAATRSGDGRGRRPQHDGGSRPPARVPGRPRPQGSPPRPPDPQPGLAPGPRLHPDEDRRDAARELSRPRGLEAVAIHSDRSQPERTRALEGFKTGETRVLVATDVAARGLDIEDLPHVVNFELPWQPQDYIHRIGRTGRAGASGDAVSLVSIDEADLLRGVQRLLKHAIPWTVEPGYEPDRNAEVQPLRGGPPELARPRSHHQPIGERPRAEVAPAQAFAVIDAVVRIGRRSSSAASMAAGLGVSSSAPGKKKPSMMLDSTRSTAYRLTWIESR